MEVSGPILATAPPATVTTTAETAPMVPIATTAPPATEAWTAGFHSVAPDYLAQTRQMVEDLRAATPPANLSDALGAIYLRAHTVATQAGLAKLPVATHVSTTLEGLLKRLHRNPRMVTASTLNTVTHALELLENLSEPGTEAKLSGFPPVRILVVDDEPLARRAVMGALQLAFQQPESAEDGSAGAALVAKKKYDVIFTDVQMPLVDGFELCAFVRSSALNAGTPVVFITSYADVGSQARAAEVGGNDFIAKPFLPVEITVKALTFAWTSRLGNALFTKAPAPKPEPEPASELVPT